MTHHNELADCVLRVLDRYFADLDGEEASGIYDMVMNCVERPLLAHVLAKAGGNQTEAARMLGISRSTLRRKLAEHRLA